MPVSYALMVQKYAYIFILQIFLWLLFLSVVGNMLVWGLFFTQFCVHIYALFGFVSAVGVKFIFAVVCQEYWGSLYSMVKIRQVY